MPVNFPFVAVAGQANFKLALILASINPAIGGVLVSGPRGSAKSTLAKALSDIMPNDEQDGRCSFVHCPLGATEEMLVGTLNLQQVLNEQKVAFQPGLLSKADNGVLYVDEVNLLQDNLVDLLLDVSVSGLNVIERDGISHSHSSQFILLGTMNPDEGELRPQLLDRFGLAVELNNQLTVDQRINVVRLREGFDKSPEVFLALYEKEQQQLTIDIQSARDKLSSIICSDTVRLLIAERCHAANVDGLRADIVWYKAAEAHAAWSNSQEVSEADVLAVEELVLSHRRKNVSPPSHSQDGSSQETESQSPFSRPPEKESNAQQKKAAGDWGSMEAEQMASSGPVAINFPSRSVAKVSSFRLATEAVGGKKRGVSLGLGRLSPKNKAASATVSWFSTLIKNHAKWPLRQLVYKKPKSGQVILHLILLDTSASTLQNKLFAKAKGAILSIAKQAYLEREQLTVLGFGNEKVETIIPQNRAPKALKQFLDNVPAAGGTPLREVLLKAQAYQQQQIQKNSEIKIRTYLITDGRTTQQFADIDLLGDVLVVDIEGGAVKRGKARQIADAISAKYFLLAVNA